MPIKAFCYIPSAESLPRDQIYLDESVYEPVAAELSAIGINTITAAQVGLRDVPQTAHLAFAAVNRRMLVTRVLPLSLYYKQPHLGVLIVSSTVTPFDLLDHIACRMLLRPFLPNERAPVVPPLGTFFPKLQRANPPPSGSR